MPLGDVSQFHCVWNNITPLKYNTKDFSPMDYNVMEFSEVPLYTNCNYHTLYFKFEHAIVNSKTCIDNMAIHGYMYTARQIKFRTDFNQDADLISVFIPKF